MSNCGYCGLLSTRAQQACYRLMGECAVNEMHARELHHFEAEKALTDLLALSWAITRDSHCSHLGADIRALIPGDITVSPQPSGSESPGMGD